MSEETKKEINIAEVNEIAKDIREKHFLDIAISPMFAKQVSSDQRRHIHTDDGFKSRAYTYAIIESDGDRYRPIDNGHHPWPNFETYEEALADAVSVSVAYQKNKQDGK